MAPPKHHIEVATFLRNKNKGEAKIIEYHDNTGRRPIPIGEFGSSNKHYYSTIGAFDKGMHFPEGHFEFAACGVHTWLPNALASSIYWLRDRPVCEFPLVCENVVKDNAKSTYRHMAYIPSKCALTVSSGQVIQWLLGVPINDNEIGLSSSEVSIKAQSIYPNWVFHECA